MRLPLPFFGSPDPEEMQRFMAVMHRIYLHPLQRPSAFLVGALVALGALNPGATSSWLRKHRWGLGAVSHYVGIEGIHSHAPERGSGI